VSGAVGNLRHSGWRGRQKAEMFAFDPAAEDEDALGRDSIPLRSAVTTSGVLNQVVIATVVATRPGNELARGIWMWPTCGSVRSTPVSSPAFDGRP
jgi:hypothetical protein